MAIWFVPLACLKYFVKYHCGGQDKIMGLSTAEVSLFLSLLLSSALAALSLLLSFASALARRAKVRHSVRQKGIANKGRSMRRRLKTELPESKADIYGRRARARPPLRQQHNIPERNRYQIFFLPRRCLVLKHAMLRSGPFISHSHGGIFLELIWALDAKFTDKQWIWIDIFCLNQVPTPTYIVFRAARH
eukprot:3765121-Rhodomonas_salina.3